MVSIGRMYKNALCLYMCVLLWNNEDDYFFVFWGETGKTVSLDPNTRIVVPEDRFGLLAIDALDPDMVCRAFQVSNFKLHIYRRIITWGSYFWFSLSCMGLFVGIDLGFHICSPICLLYCLQSTVQRYHTGTFCFLYY